MSGVTLPVSRPAGRAIVVGSAACRAVPADILMHLGYQTSDADNPYQAMLELCRRPLAFRAVVISLNSVYREELQVISAIKNRFPHIDIWLAHTDGRAAALAEASRLGADGLVGEEGLHRFAVPGAPTASEPKPAPARPPAPASAGPGADSHDDEPILSAEELRALLQEHPLPPDRTEN